ncbi:gamma-aminobutyric acid type B receptor subunit 2-like [Hydractinia symbiolongicarpus]|uniref:gamma-aminobutyric acid type B receptor subunit 2-like n=1 Tax=Hydractinia symbiolongicarpus TaxID=13093 RepID=UPI00254D926A|nr:gamma-aminobutyric acid type B receptor subunit 2-like [Hydractinia symbiolongicarpus]
MRKYMCLLIALFAILFFHATKSEFIQKKLDFAVLLPNDTVDGGCIRHAIEMGFEDVNKMPGFITLNDTYEFKLVPRTAVVDEEPGNAIEALFNLYHSDEYPRIFGTIGPPYKDQTELCVEYSTVNANLHIPYTETNEPMEQYFVFFYQSTPSILAKFETARRLTDRYEWKRVGILFDYSDKLYRKNADNLRAELVKKNEKNQTVNVISDHGIWSSPPEYSVSRELIALQLKGTRIIMALTSVPGARKIFCEAYHRQMYSPKVTWILFETLPSDWASSKYDSIIDKKTNKKTREITCSEEELLIAANGYISITKQKVRRDKKKTINNMTADDFVKRLKSRLAPNTECPEHTAYAYDAVWTQAVTYQRFFLRSGRAFWNFTSEDIGRYYVFGLSLVKDIQMITYEGITGRVSYEPRVAAFSRVGQISIWSNKNTTVYVGTDDSASKNLSMVPDEVKVLFKEAKVPLDEAIYVKTYSDIAKPLLITMWIIACIGILLAILFLIVTLIFTQDKNISMQSPAINCVIIFGSVLCYSSVIIYGLDTRFTSKENTHYICWSFLFTLSTGFTLTFGSLFAKAWQLYKLYMTPEVKVENNQIHMKKIPEWSLLVIIGIFLLFDAIILSTWGIISPFDYETRNVTNKENLFADKIEIEQIVGCSCEYETEFTIGMYCYKGVILIFGIFLAWQTRNAKIKMQNESKQIAMAIYNVVAVSVIGVICVSVLANTTRHHATYAIVAVCICICTTTTLLLVFCPQISKIINADSISINSSKSGRSSPNGLSYEDKYNVACPRKSIEKEGGDIKPALSTGTLNTQLSTEQTHQSSCGSVENAAGSPFTGNSILSFNASYLSNSVFMTPPAYETCEEPRRRVDSMGRLSSGIYVGTIEEETDAEGKRIETSTEENQL